MLTPEAMVEARKIRVLSALAACSHVWELDSAKEIGTYRYSCLCLLSAKAPYDALCPDRVLAALIAASGAECTAVVAWLRGWADELAAEEGLGLIDGHIIQYTRNRADDLEGGEHLAPSSPSPEPQGTTDV